MGTFVLCSPVSSPGWPAAEPRRIITLPTTSWVSSRHLLEGMTLVSQRFAIERGRDPDMCRHFLREFTPTKRCGKLGFVHADVADLKTWCVTEPKGSSDLSRGFSLGPIVMSSVSARPKPLGKWPEGPRWAVVSVWDVTSPPFFPRPLVVDGREEFCLVFLFFHAVRLFVFCFCFVFKLSWDGLSSFMESDTISDFLKKCHMLQQLTYM